MPTAARIAYGATLGIHNGSTYDDVAEIINITPYSYSRDAIDVTNQDSANTFREYIAGFMDAGEATFDVNFIADESDPIIAAMVAGVGQFKITFAGGTKNIVFSAIVTGYEPSMPVDDKMTAAVTLKVTGKPTLAAS